MIRLKHCKVILRLHKAINYQRPINETNKGFFSNDCGAHLMHFNMYFYLLLR